jgi:hypothetical protein
VAVLLSGHDCGGSRSGTFRVLPAILNVPGRPPGQPTGLLFKDGQGILDLTASEILPITRLMSLSLLCLDKEGNMEQLLDQNLIGVSIANDGAEIAISLVDAGLLARRRTLRCKGVIVLEWHRTPPDTAPYIIPEISWEIVSLDAIPKLLAGHRYGFHDSDGTVWHRFSRPLVHVRLEGAICADVICEHVEPESE